MCSHSISLAESGRTHGRRRRDSMSERESVISETKSSPLAYFFLSLKLPLGRLGSFSQNVLQIIFAIFAILFYFIILLVVCLALCK